jgi:hypothetical protein
VQEEKVSFIVQIRLESELALSNCSKGTCYRRVICRSAVKMQPDDAKLDASEAIAPPTNTEGTDDSTYVQDTEKDAVTSNISKEEKEVKEEEEPYSIFTIAEKRFITFIASLTTLLPPFTGSMYYPVITLLAEDLNVSISAVNLTITAYLVRCLEPTSFHTKRLWLTHD